MRVHAESCSRIVTERVRIKNVRFEDGDKLSWERVVVHECPCGGIELESQGNGAEGEKK